MNTTNHVQHPDRNPIPLWLKICLIGLLIEKIIQHIVVSLAFFFDWDAIGATVVISPRLLLLLGVIAAACFAVSLWGIVHHASWALALIIALALFDIIGELAAQGRLAIMITVSFMSAILLLVLALKWRRADRQACAIEPA